MARSMRTEHKADIVGGDLQGPTQSHGGIEMLKSLLFFIPNINSTWQGIDDALPVVRYALKFGEGHDAFLGTF